MRHIDFEFNGNEYALSFTAEALFTVYDKFGVGNILENSKIMEPTPEGWTNCCWMLALLASQGELQRRHMGETPREMLSLEDVRTGCMAGDIPRIRASVRAALEQGLRRETEDDSTRKEVNLVLQAREDTAKKAKLLAQSALATLRQQLPDFISAFGKRSS